jgi:plastocyanin
MKRLAMHAVVIILAVLLIWHPRDAAATDHVVTQKKMQFQVNGTKLETLTIKAGDTISFVNEDTMAHNVFSRTAGFEFDLKSLRATATGTHTFSKAGTLEIECALHPRMKFKLVVDP